MNCLVLVRDQTFNSSGFVTVQIQEYGRNNLMFAVKYIVIISCVIDEIVFITYSLVSQKDLSLGDTQRK